MRAAQIMTHPPITANAQTTLKAAAALMLQHSISGLPVLSAFGELVGMITEGDLLRGLGPRPDSDLKPQDERTVAELMSLDAIFVTPDAPLSEVVTTMDTYHVKRVPVLSQGKLVGIVSRADVLRTLLMRDVPPLLASEAEHTVHGRRVVDQLA
jgi:CBS domain-containing protein